MSSLEVGTIISATTLNISPPFSFLRDPLSDFISHLSAAGGEDKVAQRSV